MTYGREAGASVSAGRKLNRRDFLKMSGAGLAGVTLLGSTACGGGSSGSGNLLFSMGTDTTGTLPGLVDEVRRTVAAKAAEGAEARDAAIDEGQLSGSQLPSALDRLQLAGETAVENSAANECARCVIRSALNRVRIAGHHLNDFIKDRFVHVINLVVLRRD